MRIVIDALAARYGGTAAATVQLARYLARSSNVSDVALVTRSGSIVEAALARDEGVNCVALPPQGHAELIWRVAWEALRLPAMVRQERRDVVISMSGILPRSPGSRVVCLIGNPVMYEETTPANILRRWAVRRTAREAEYLAAPSRHMAEMVSASVRRPCAVLAWGVDHSIFYPADSFGEEILCVADFKAYKRHDLIIDAWLRLAAPRPPLRFVGNPDVDRPAHARLVKQIRALAEAESVRLDYKVAHEQMPDIYRRARVFVMASEHESFCMPIAESMACGIPVVARGLRSIRETGGTGARYVDGDDPARWAAAIEELRTDDVAYGRVRAEALRAAARFSWEAFGQALVARL